MKKLLAEKRPVSAKKKEQAKQMDPSGKEKLIKVSLDLFSKKGYKGTSIRDIANAMNMSISNIYYYFGSKAGLLKAILEGSTVSLSVDLEKIAQAQMKPLDRFKEIVKNHIILSGKYKKESKILFLDEEDLDPNENELNRRIQRGLLDIYITELTILKEEGYLNSTNVTLLAFNILAVINWRYRWYKSSGPLSLEEVADEMLLFILHGILRSERDAGEEGT